MYLSTDSSWIDVVLDAILNRRLSTEDIDIVQESQVHLICPFLSFSAEE
jgi:hypothetical protein